jgi:hypothetical protein
LICLWSTLQLFLDQPLLCLRCDTSYLHRTVATIFAVAWVFLLLVYVFVRSCCVWWLGEPDVLDEMVSAVLCHAVAALQRVL